MYTLNELLKFEHNSEHILEHDLKSDKPYSAPKIYNAKGDLSKRWYVYYSFRNPKSKKMERMQNIYGIAHKYKSKEDRMYILMCYRNAVLKLLQEGFSPFADNQELYLQQSKSIKRKSEVVDTKTSNLNTTLLEQDNSMLIISAFEFALNLKSRTIKESTLQDYGYKVDGFLKWLNTNQTLIIRVKQLTKKVVLDFLNYKLINSGPRTRNNYRTELGSLMQLLEDNDILESNHFKKTKVLKTKPERHKRYNQKQQKEIFEHLEKQDPVLLLYIKFISYNFIRPIEVNRIQIKDINTKEKTLVFRSKTKVSKTKIIPDILFKELPDISKLNGEMYLFTPHKIGDYWDATEKNRRDYFSKSFLKNVKKPFDLGKNYGLYSFRHTYITKLYRKLEETQSPYEAKSKLMQITGHTTMGSLEKYLRDIDAVLPKDYSKLFE